MISSLSQWVIPSLDKQSYLEGIVRLAEWQIDLAIGVVTFGEQHRWHAEPLGTQSDIDDTWLWAWAHAKNSIPAHLLAASLALKAYGEQHGIPELTTPRVPLDQIDGHTLALIASGICEANAYYRCPYEGGALFVLIMDDNFPKCPDPPLQRIATVFPQAIASLDIPDHKLALTGHLDHYGLGHEQDGDKVVVRENGEPVLTATFDGQNRLTNLKVRLSAPAAEDPGSQAEGVGQSGPSESWEQMQLRLMLGR